MNHAIYVYVYILGRRGGYENSVIELNGRSDSFDGYGEHFINIFHCRYISTLPNCRPCLVANQAIRGGDSREIRNAMQKKNAMD